MFTLSQRSSGKMQGMEITAEQYERIQDCLPVQRGNVRHENLVLLNAILYVAEHGCKWRGLPKRYGNWHSIPRIERWLIGRRRNCRLAQRKGIRELTL